MATRGRDQSAASGPEWKAATSRPTRRFSVIKLARVAHFPDLDPYAYPRPYEDGVHAGVVHVGWLDGIHPFPKGPVAPSLIEKMKLLAANPVELYRGRHICELCVEPADVVKTFVPGMGKLIDPNSSWLRWAEQRWGNGEIRVAGEGVIYAAPVLVVHYVEEHGYLPPAQFLKAVEEAG